MTGKLETDSLAPARAERETLLRAADRRKVAQSRAGGRWLRLAWLLAGPGILAMLGENDGPSMVSYAATGASYGIGFFIPFILLTFAMAYAVQEMTIRLGIATRRGHAELIFQRFGPFWGYLAMADLVVGNLLTLVTEFIAIQAGGRYFGVPPRFAVAAGAALVLASLGLRRYATWERAMMALAAVNLVFIPAAWLAHPSLAAIGGALIGWRPLPPAIDMTFVTLIMADIGATVTPWMIFFQQSAVVDKGLTRLDLPQGRLETALGAALAALAGIAALVAASPLHAAGVPAAQLQSGADFATALRPHLGPGASLFALGIIEAGVLAAITISTSSSYALAETLAVRHSLNLDFREGLLFYGVAALSTLAAAGIVLIPGAPMLAITLTVNVVATLLMAPALLFLLLLINDREIVGAELANGWRGNLLGGAIVLGIAMTGVAYGFIIVFPHCFGG